MLMNNYIFIFSLIWCVAGSLSAADGLSINSSYWFTKTRVIEWLMLARDCAKNNFSLIPSEVQGRIFSRIDPLQSSRAWKQDEPVLVERWHIPDEVTFIAAENHLMLFATLGEIRDTPDKTDCSMLQESRVDETDLAYLEEHKDSRTYYVYTLNCKTFRKSSKVVQVKHEMPASWGHGLEFELCYNPALLRSHHPIYHRKMSFAYTCKKYKCDRLCYSAKKSVQLIDPYATEAGGTVDDARFIAVLYDADLKFKAMPLKYLREDFQVCMHDKKELILKENARSHEYYRKLRTQDPRCAQPNTYAKYALPKLSACMGYYNQFPSDDDNRLIAVKKDPSNSAHSIIEVYIPASKVCMQHYCVYQAYIIAQKLAGSDSNNKIWKLFKKPVAEGTEKRYWVGAVVQETAELYDCVEAFKKVGILENGYTQITSIIKPHVTDLDEPNECICF